MKMSFTPPVPPPPPPPLSLDIAVPKSPQLCYINNSPFVNQDVCKWGTEYPDLWEACSKYQLCLHEPPYKYKYKQFDSLIQIGPTCGMVALSMLLNAEVSPDEMLNISKLEGYTIHGEMFSCKNMEKLAQKVLSLAEIDNVRYNVRVGGLFSNEIVEKLLNGAVLLVPYDADCNHSPCLRHGHTAHWAFICGVLIINEPTDSYTADPSNIYVFARHGKSRYVAAWKLADLEKSNRNLEQFSPKKEGDGLIYVLPEGGIGGENGLRNQFLIFEGL